MIREVKINGMPNQKEIRKSAFEIFKIEESIDETDEVVVTAKEIHSLLKKKTLTHRMAGKTLKCVKALLEDNLI